MPKRPLVVAQNNEQIYFEDFTQGSLKRSKLRNVYLTLPVDFQWVLNPKYTDYEAVSYTHLDVYKRQFLRHLQKLKIVVIRKAFRFG